MGTSVIVCVVKDPYLILKFGPLWVNNFRLFFLFSFCSSELRGKFHKERKENSNREEEIRTIICETEEGSDTAERHINYV